MKTMKRFFGHRLMPHSLSQSPCQHHPHMLHQGSRRDKARGSRDLWLYIIFVLSRKMVTALTLVKRTPSPAVWTHLPRRLPRQQLPTGLLEPTETTSQTGTGRPRCKSLCFCLAWRSGGPRPPFWGLHGPWALLPLDAKTLVL